MIAATAIVWLSTAALLWELVSSRWLDWLGHIALPVGAVGAVVLAIAFNAGLQFVKKHFRHDPPFPLRLGILIVALAGIIAAGLRLQSYGQAIHHGLHDIARAVAHWLRSLPGAMGDAAGWIIGLLHHPGAFRMSIGLLSVTIIAIALLGWLRWLVQPLPVQEHEHGQGMRPWQ